jgi:hypothetical protein
MSRRTMELQEAVAILTRNGVKVEGMRITVPTVGLGLGMWRAIDCLVNYHKFVKV